MAQVMQEEVEIKQEPPQDIPKDSQSAPPASDSDFDYTQDLNELQGIGKELQDIEASVENNFADFIVDLISNDPTFEDLFFSDRKTFFKKVIDEQNKFVQSLVEPRVKKAQELESNIKSKQELQTIDSIKKDFQKRHPDVDIKELIVFFTNELPPKVQEEIKAQPIEQFFDIIYAIYQQMTNPQASQPQEPQKPPAPENLPSQANGVAIASDEANTNGYDLPMNRY